jgi:hypothetical protein
MLMTSSTVETIAGGTSFVCPGDLLGAGSAA